MKNRFGNEQTYPQVMNELISQLCWIAVSNPA
ncbi:hypothetical protein SAMN05421831_10323 [Allopseudospirillum japonicum]|uniref:Uncharacterized protein n=1 Tax=Allopseudospirillum japonicum TaxID=64971 RepID=A0A1H6RDD0_9GAMM|nr:hypothetical protein SAMN05421831_10323 [Allopseudospirillum japonicum]